MYNSSTFIVKCSWDGLPEGNNCSCVWSFWCSELCSVDQMVTVQRGSVLDVRGPEWFCQRSLSRVILKETWWRLLNNKIAHLVKRVSAMIYNSQVYLPYESLFIDLSNFTTPLSPNNFVWYTIKVQWSLKQAYLFPAVHRKNTWCNICISVDVYCDAFIAKKEEEKKRV